MASKNKNLYGTFALNKHEAFHRWYPYIEGFSSSLVEDELKSINCKTGAVYDPFGGCGTTPLTATQNGLKAYYSETNPFMAYICDAKINIAKKAYDRFDIVNKIISNMLIMLDKYQYGNFENSEYQGFEKFYHPNVLAKILLIRYVINNYCIGEIENKISKVALSCIQVNVSKMIRRGDLRYAKENEKTEIDFNVIELFKEKVNSMMEDIRKFGSTIKSVAMQLSEDARNITEENLVDCIITSPPYLNGTNYIRNTKLELKLMDYIKTEGDLPKYHSKGIIAGINNVSKRNILNVDKLDEIKDIIEELENVAYDKRIPQMVTGYFYGMDKVFNKLRNILIDKGYLILDIGDSQFAGVHIPTHKILNTIAENKGFIPYDETILRSRRSKNGMILTQRIIRYKLNKWREI